MLRHAGEIVLATGDRASAQKYLQQAAELNAGDSEMARATLAHLSADNQHKLLQQR
jgi:hypothetical protein